MSTAPLGTIGSVAAGLQQTRSADADRTAQEASNQSRQAESSRRAVDAAGIGQTEREGETSDRDADGRRLWERSGKPKKEPTSEPPVDSDPPAQSKDPSGNAGNQLDLSG